MRTLTRAVLVMATPGLVFFACTDLGGLSQAPDAGDSAAPDPSDGGALSSDGASDASTVEASAAVSPGVHCGAFDCDAGLRCCYDNPTTCASSCPTSATEYACDEPGDCDAGELCCAKLIGNLVAGSTCGSGCVARLCSSNEHCLAPTTCKTLGAPFPPGIASCR